MQSTSRNDEHVGAGGQRRGRAAVARRGDRQAGGRRGQLDQHVVGSRGCSAATAATCRVGDRDDDVQLGAVAGQRRALCPQVGVPSGHHGDDRDVRVCRLLTRVGEGGREPLRAVAVVPPRPTPPAAPPGRGQQAGPLVAVRPAASAPRRDRRRRVPRRSRAARRTAAPRPPRPPGGRRPRPRQPRSGPAWLMTTSAEVSSAHGSADPSAVPPTTRASHPGGRERVGEVGRRGAAAAAEQHGDAAAAHRVPRAAVEARGRADEGGLRKVRTQVVEQRRVGRPRGDDRAGDGVDPARARGRSRRPGIAVTLTGTPSVRASDGDLDRDVDVQAGRAGRP